MDINTSGTNQEKKIRIQRYVIILLSLALMGTWAYLIINKNSVQQIWVEKDKIISEGINQKDQLQKELEDATARYESLKTSGARKDSTILMRDNEINIKKEKIQALLAQVNAGKESLMEARKLIGELNADIDQFKMQIELLQKENMEISMQRDDANREKDVFAKQYDSAKTVIANKEETIDIGSTLNATNFQVIAIDEKRNGKEVKLNNMKHGKINKLRLQFNLEPNRLANTGEKDLFVSVIDPDGKLLTDPSSTRGYFVSRDGIQVFYSTLIKVNYLQNQRQVVSFDWRQAESFKKGRYAMSVYQNGFKIGEGGCVMK